MLGQEALQAARVSPLCGLKDEAADVRLARCAYANAHVSTRGAGPVAEKCVESGDSVLTFDEVAPLCGGPGPLASSGSPAPSGVPGSIVLVLLAHTERYSLDVLEHRLQRHAGEPIARAFERWTGSEQEMTSALVERRAPEMF